MKALFFTDAGLNPSGHLRWLSSFRQLEAQGIRCSARFCSLAEPAEADSLGLASGRALVQRFFAAQRQVTFDADVVVIHHSAAGQPWLPGWLSSAGRPPLVVDCDESTSTRAPEVVALCEAATVITASTARLARHLGAPDKTVVLPTTVDLETATPFEGNKGPGLVLGWLGPSTAFPLLRRVLPELVAAVAAIPGARLRLVSDAVLSDFDDEPLVEQWAWRAERATMALRSFDVALAPADLHVGASTELAGVQALLSMATGVPVLLTESPETRATVPEGPGVQWVTPSTSWSEAVRALTSAGVNRKALGRAARERLRGSHEAAASTVLSVLQRCAPSARRASGPRSTNPAKVCLAISSYRSDEQVLRLVDEVARWPANAVDGVLVVDSVGRTLGPALERRGLGAKVRYVATDDNVGSAGNLSQRLQLAADAGYDFVYTINHDGHADRDVIARLVDFAVAHPETGAVYPLRRRSHRQGQYDLTGTFRLPVPFVGSTEPPRDEALPVHWASSNGALYRLSAVREGLTPWADLWMGWEDLAYGWLLESRGLRQVVLPSAVINDDYEYRNHNLAGFHLSLTDKPSWYAYYQFRNLLLAAARTNRGATEHALIAARFGAELGLTMMFRDDKARRIRLLWQGALDGLRGRSGRGPVP